MSHFCTARAGPRNICTVIIHFVATAVKLAHYKFLHHHGEVRLCPEGTIMCRTCPSKESRRGRGGERARKTRVGRQHKKIYLHIYFSRPAAIRCRQLAIFVSFGWAHSTQSTLGELSPASMASTSIQKVSTTTTTNSTSSTEGHRQ